MSSLSWFQFPCPKSSSRVIQTNWFVRSIEGDSKNMKAIGRRNLYLQLTSPRGDINDPSACGRWFQQWQQLFRQVYGSTVIDVNGFHSMFIYIILWRVSHRSVVYLLRVQCSFVTETGGLYNSKQICTDSTICMKRYTPYIMLLDIPGLLLNVRRTHRRFTGLHSCLSLSAPCSKLLTNYAWNQPEEVTAKNPVYIWDWILPGYQDYRTCVWSNLQTPSQTRRF